MGSWAGIPTSTADTVVVPERSSRSTVHFAGHADQPLRSAFEQDATNTWQDQVLQIGMGATVSTASRSTGRRRTACWRSILNTPKRRNFFQTVTLAGTTIRPSKEQAAHGVAVVEIKLGAGSNWTTIRSTKGPPHPVNTPMDGPASGGHRLLCRPRRPTRFASPTAVTVPKARHPDRRKLKAAASPWGRDKVAAPISTSAMASQDKALATSGRRPNSILGGRSPALNHPTPGQNTARRWGASNTKGAALLTAANGSKLSCIWATTSALTIS